MVGLVVLRFVTIVVISGQSVTDFFNDPYAVNYYVFSLVITLMISLIFHAIYFYKALTENKVKEQEIVAKTETAKFESLKSQGIRVKIDNRENSSLGFKLNDSEVKGIPMRIVIGEKEIDNNEFDSEDSLKSAIVDALVKTYPNKKITFDYYFNNNDEIVKRYDESA